ncbi:MAG: SoxR reducing system RseC family protein [Rikenellaceae bacterium]
MDSKRFSHSGRVIAVGSSSLRVAFEAKGACGGCAARAKCGMVDSSTREVDVELPTGRSFEVGDQVEVAISYQMGIMSVVVAYIIPLVILLVALVAALSLNIGEGSAAIIALGVVALYYVGVYIFRSKLDKQIKFTIEN